MRLNSIVAKRSSNATLIFLVVTTNVPSEIHVISTMCQVNEFLAGAGTDAPDVDEENIISRPSVSYDDMWAKTLLESTEMEV